MPIKHAFTNPKSDGGDATVTRPSDWNADHEGGCVLLAETVLSGTSSTITFSSISSGFKDLKVIGRVRGDTAATVRDSMLMRVGNGSVDTGSNYQIYVESHFGGGTSTRTADTSGQTSWNVLRAFVPGASATAGRFGSFEITVVSYAVTGQQRQYHGIGSCMPNNTNTDMVVSQGFGFWSDTASAIDTVSFFLTGGGNFVAGTEIRLYGLN